MRTRAITRQDDVLSVMNLRAKPLKAYQILEELRAHEPDSAPQTAHRTLSAPTDQGRARRLASIKAFVPCRCNHAESVPVLAICEECGSVEEHDGSGLLPKLTKLTDHSAFRAERHIVEIHGQCGICAA